MLEFTCAREEFDLEVSDDSAGITFVLRCRTVLPTAGAEALHLSGNEGVARLAIIEVKSATHPSGQSIGINGRDITDRAAIPDVIACFPIVAFRAAQESLRRGDRVEGERGNSLPAPG